MPTIAANQQPTIAIITANYSEKLAVDAMMEQKTTFVKFKTEGSLFLLTGKLCNTFTVKISLENTLINSSQLKRQLLICMKMILFENKSIKRIKNIVPIKPCAFILNALFLASPQISLVSISCSCQKKQPKTYFNINIDCDISG